MAPQFGGSSPWFANEGPARQQEQVTALVGATIHPVSRAPISNGVVLVQGSRITAVGEASSVTIPDGAVVVNLSGKHLYPGMIDPATQLGMIEIGQVAASRDDREIGPEMTPRGHKKHPPA